jgi:hypothetical protein
MPQSRLGEVMIYADITEVRQETRIAACKKLLENGWVLLGVYPLTTAGEPQQRKPRKGQQEQNPKDTPRYVQRMVGYVVGQPSAFLHPAAARDSFWTGALQQPARAGTPASVF